MIVRLHRGLICLALAVFNNANAQKPSKPGSDSLILTDGERLIGNLVHSNDASVIFKSNVLGELTIAWSKIKELHSPRTFAVITKNMNLKGKHAAEQVPEGLISMSDQKLEVSAPGGIKTIPVAEAEHVLDEPNFEKAFIASPSLLENWHGTVTAGASLVEATQKSRTFTESVSLVRGSPEQDWLPRRDRTSVDFTSAYGKVIQPGAPSLKTSIFHADIERDEYFSARAYAFEQALFDHNFSQGLDLQQTYAAGLGVTVIKRPGETLDLKVGASFIRQEFSEGRNQNLVSSVFNQRFRRKLWRGSTLAQEITVNPAWNNTSAFTASGNATLAIPVYKRFTFTTGVIENFLNDPPPGFRRNSFQFTTGLTYLLK